MGGVVSAQYAKNFLNLRQNIKEIVELPPWINAAAFMVSPLCNGEIVSLLFQFLARQERQFNNFDRGPSAACRGLMAVRLRIGQRAYKLV